MPHYRVAAAMAAAAFISLSAAAEAASFRDPVQRAEGPVSGEITNVGDPFLPRKPKTKTYTYQLSCEVADETFANGASVIKMVNTGTETIPAGAVIEVTYPDGTTKKFTTASDIKPGGAVSIMGPLDATAENFPCSAGATSTGPVVEAQASDAPVGNPKLPPKLTCEFTIVGNVVTITWKNVGGSPVMPGQSINGTTSSGIGMTVVLTDPIDPGEEFQVTHTWDNFDPAWFDGQDCQAKIKK